ncbi:MAG: hypothetical protein F4X11_12865 [Acidobacteria bacterium]|nr:hypothetical protein [Acidobacteriota bacterium]
MRPTDGNDRRTQLYPRPPTLRKPEVFADAGPTAHETQRLSRACGPEETGRGSITVERRLARSCAGWDERPKSGEFYDAIRAEKPDRRQRTLLRVFSQEAEWHELISAWAEGAYTLRQLVAALHRAGHAQCRAARALNQWAIVPPAEDE